MTRYAAKGEEVRLFSLPKDYLGRMKEQPQYRWYKPILAFLLALVILFAGTMIVGFVYETLHPSTIDLSALISEDSNGEVDFSSVLAAAEEAANSQQSDAYINIDFTDPIAIFLEMVGIVLMIPAIGIGMKVTGLGGLRTLSSEQGGLRWKRLAKLALPIFVATAILQLATTFIPLLITGSLSELGEARFAPLALLMILIIVPLQSAAEEYFFRGFVMQTFASWIPVTVISLILSALFFGAGHSYNMLGNIGICIDGLLWSWLIVKTGGLEVTICLHAANNTVGMLLTSVFASAAATSTVTIEGFIFDVAMSLAMVIFAYLWCMRNGYLIADAKPVAAEAEAESTEA